MKLNKWAAALATTALSVSVFANDVYVIHGINGTDLGTDTPLPVDISINGTCALTDVQFADVLGPVDLAPGTYDVAITLSDGVCGGTLATAAAVDIALTETATIVAHLSEQGTPSITKYINDLHSASGRAKLTIRHDAAAPPVKVYVTKNHRTKALWELDNPDERTSSFRPGEYDIFVFAADRGFRRQRVTGPLPVQLDADVAYFVHAVGSVKNATFDVIVQTIHLD